MPIQESQQRENKYLAISEKLLKVTWFPICKDCYKTGDELLSSDKSFPSFPSYSSWDEILLLISVSSWSKVSRSYIETILIPVIWSWKRNAASYPMQFIASASFVVRNAVDTWLQGKD